ncbi:MAG: hypothetical protein ACNA77_09760 [Opitutales bacterium]
MPELGETRIEKILTDYYELALGGAESWEKVMSLSIIGKVETKDGAFTIIAYQKKPDLLKMSFSPESGQGVLTLAYDGEVAWKQSGRQGQPERMPELEARRFIHSSRFGNHLLYPFAEGKKIRLVDTVPIEGAICHQVRVELDSGYQVDYFLDIRSYLEVKVINTDLVNKSSNSIIYKDHKREFGLPIARTVRSLEEGEWASTLKIDEVKVNPGIMPWMFHLPK